MANALLVSHILSLFYSPEVTKLEKLVKYLPHCTRRRAVAAVLGGVFGEGWGESGGAGRGRLGTGLCIYLELTFFLYFLIFYNPKSYKSFGNSLVIAYANFAILDIKFRFACGESDPY